MRRHVVSALAAALAFTAAAAVTPASAAADPAGGDGCPDVQILAVPGTWETSQSADPAVVSGMLGRVTAPLLAQFRGSAVSVAAATVAYPAQVGGPVVGLATGNPLTLGQSRRAGLAALTGRAEHIVTDCPLTQLVVLGYSQGALVAGDFLGAVGNRRDPLHPGSPGGIDPSRILAGALLADPHRSSTEPPQAGSDTTTAPTTPATSTAPPPTRPAATLDARPAPTGTDWHPPKQVAFAETMIGPNLDGQGVLGPRPGGMGVLAERVTTMCARTDAVCALPEDAHILAAVAPLLDLSPADIPGYLTGRAVTLMRNIVSSSPQLLAAAAKSLMAAMTRLTVAAAAGPEAIPAALASIVFGSTLLDDIAHVVRMPEFDALVEATHPDELAREAGEVAAYLVLDAHRSYSHYPVTAGGLSATDWIATWVAGKIRAGL